MKGRTWLILLALASLFLWLTHNPIKHAPGVLAPELPVQTTLKPATPPIAYGEYSIKPLAKFTLKARVLSRADYYFDSGADLSPTDLALGWSHMSDSQIIDQLTIRQSGRWYSYSWNDSPPIDPNLMALSSANMHLIPADKVTAKTLARVRVGHLVSLHGYLIEATRKDGWHWKSSLTREDRGAGACELIWVERISYQ
jgi:hypothetical protein